MLISPPFLPTGLTDHAGPDDDPLMTAIDSYELAHGIYPIAFDRRWHTGIHLNPNSQNERVRAIADGEVVAYRVCQKALDGGSGEPDSTAGFVLLKHKTETGDGRLITFYSLYMHLRELDGYGDLAFDQEELPVFLQTASPGEIITAPITPPPAQSGNGIKVKRKDILGLVGRCHGQNHLHFEIFMLPGDFDAYFTATSLGNKQPVTPNQTEHWGHSYFIIPPNQQFLAKPPGTGSNNKLHGVTIIPLTSGTNDGYSIHVEYYFHKGNKYTRTWSIKDSTKTLLTSQPVPEVDYEYEMHTRSTKLYSTCPSEGNELLRFGRISSSPYTLASADDRATWMRVTYASGKEGYIDISSDTIMKLSDADLPIVSGWEKVSQSDANTPFKNDGMCDVEILKKLVQTVAAKSWLPEEYEDENALSDYLKNDAELRATLQGFVCHAPTEWDSSQNETRYAALNEPDGFYGQQKQMNPTGTGYSDFLALLKKFQFWDVSGLPSQELWFFHPLKFLRVFRRCNWLSQSEMNQIYAESNYSILHKDGSTYKNQYRLSINKVFRKYGLNNGVRMSHFFGQVAIESAHLMAVRETSISVPVAIRTNHISVMPEPNGYLQAPPANAADVQYFVTKYEGKTALGNTDTGDGVKFRGRGLKQLTGRYNYSKYWEFRGWSVGGPYNPTWFSASTNGHYPPGPIIDHPEVVGNDDYNCADTGGFFWSLYKVAKAADGGITQAASHAVSALVNYYDHESPPRRWAETQLASQILGD